jgi:hypothetical protein
VKFRAFLAAAVVLAMVTSAQAVSLIIMAENSNLTGVDPTLAGYTAYEIGVQVTAADVKAGGNNPVLLVQNLTFTGDGGVNPYQSPDSVDDVTGVQGLISTDSKAAANRVGPSNKSGPAVTLGATTAEDLYTDSWWYSGTASGLLSGIFNSNAKVGTITTNPAADGSGVYAIGQAATNATTLFAAMGTKGIGTTGYIWAPQATGLVPDSGSGTTMLMGAALYGPLGANFLNPSTGTPLDPNHILGDMLVANGGTLTVPLAQIVANGNFSIPSQLNGGSGTFIEVGTQTYNVLGGPAGTDPGAMLLASGQSPGLPILTKTPEPGTFVLAGMGAIGLALAWRRRK